MNTPNELLYAASHEWLRQEADGSVTVGITDFAQDQLGDVVFVELPAVGSRVSQGEQVAVVESVKTASDIYTPVSGTVTAVNKALEARPEAINEAPYEAGWMFQIAPSVPQELGSLLSADDYASQASEGA